MSKNNLASLPPFVQGRSLENSRWYMGNVMTFLVNSEQTAGAFSMTEYLSKPGNEPPAHVHDREDEFIYVLEGRIDAYIGKEVFSAGRNDGVYFPKFIPHTFTILTPQLRMLIWMSPGGFEGYFRDMSEPARSLGLPEHAANYGEVDMDHALRSWKRTRDILPFIGGDTTADAASGKVPRTLGSRPRVHANRPNAVVQKGENHMRYKLLGKSGLRVSELCLGTMTFGEDSGWGSSKDESRKVYDAFLETGGNFIDTANIYTNGTSERFLGEFMADHRDRIVLATKYTLAVPGNDPNAAGNHRKSMMQAIEASLKRLKTDYIDLYWLHVWDQITPIEEVMRVFDDLVRQGKILYAGVSDMPAWLVARGNTLAELRAWPAFVGLQIEYSLIERTPERELLPMAASLGLGITAWSPLAGGLLTGKQLEPGRVKESRQSHAAMQQFVKSEARIEAVVREVVAVARESGHSPAQVALAWLRQRPQPVIPIIGARKFAQVKDNLACAEVKLDPALIERLNGVSRIEMGFPHDMFARDMVRSVSSGGIRDQIDV